MTQTETAPVIVTPEQFLTYWQGQRRLTRRVIEAFPIAQTEDQLFSFSIGGMRPFGVMAWEIYQVSALTLGGLLSGEWPMPDWREGVSFERAALLKAWDDLTEQINRDFLKVDIAFYAQQHLLPWGEMSGWAAAIYAVDNETHHRGEGYVYLRALGIEPPAFYER
ncbi:damage-inducible protein DinB [Deinococcus psychrotolerans]|uniref:Damage-inducible protein DinB n=1 Tax=Deinococcus psychrotolerans TaxID=2489213 RepID=A0A3G8YDA3_9DEIO|nr:DinB family protein [Deinococcus psychrotolerans]AZI42840.1 damage-inducible protein DinB [Deinococcus psychrotolerans]